MELVKFEKTVNLPLTPTKIMRLEAGKSYIMAQTIARQISQVFGKHIVAYQQNFEVVYGNKRYNGEPLDGKKIAIWRTGGAGDLLFISPCVKKLKSLYPSSEITLATSARYLDILDSFEYADKKIALPIPSTVLDEVDYYCIFENLIEENKEAEKLNAYDLFAKRLGVLDKMENYEKLPIVMLSEDNIAWANKYIDTVAEPGKSRIVSIQAASSAILRTFDATKLSDVIKSLVSSGCTVLLLGGPKNKEMIEMLIKSTGLTKGVYNTTLDSPSWLQSAALIAKSDLAIVPDSSLAHVAAALETPVLGLYGPFTSDVRFKYYKNAVAIDPHASCNPCYAHGQLPCKWVGNSASLCSKCFDPITADLVVDVARQMLKAVQ